MHVRGDDDAKPRARRDIDVRIDAPLADQLQLRQPLDERRADLRALADQHQRLDVFQPFGERVCVLHMIVPHLDVVPGELGEGAERAHRVVIVVEDGDFHQHGAGGAATRFGSMARRAFGQVSLPKSTGSLVSPAPRAHFDRLQKSS